MLDAIEQAGTQRVVSVNSAVRGGLPGAEKLAGMVAMTWISVPGARPGGTWK
jgi:hypothetical protein